MTNFDFKWLLPFVLPIVIYGYFRLFFAVIGSDMASAVDFRGMLELLSMVGGMVFGLAIAAAMDIEKVKWRWLARKGDTE